MNAEKPTRKQKQPKGKKSRKKLGENVSTDASKSASKNKIGNQSSTTKDLEQAKSSNLTASEVDIRSENEENEMEHELFSTMALAWEADEDSEAKRDAHQTAYKICEEIAEGYWDLIWEICHTRFVYENASGYLCSELRNTWLDIMAQNWMDLDAVDPIGNGMPSSGDVPPLPPKCDFWAQGALEVLPHHCRESVIDPFIRDFFSSFNQYKYSETVGESDGMGMGPVDVDDRSLTPSESTEFHRNLPRPSSPMSSETNTWSTDAVLGSLRGENELLMRSYFSHQSLETEVDSTTGGSNSRLSSNFRKSSKALEMLYRSPYQIRASTEIVYTISDNKDLEQVVFKLPNQTSSEAVRALEKERQKKSTEGGT